MNTRTRYLPPAINRDWLCDELLRQYEGHRESLELLAALVDEYFRLWRLFRMYPERRVVATGPIMAVQRVHYNDRERYFYDCMEYFNRFLNSEFVWKGRSDVHGTIQTVVSYKELYEVPPPAPWQDITKEFELGRSHLQLVN